MTANDLRHDTPEPDPPTPEEWYDRATQSWSNVSAIHRDIFEWERITALRDMIAGLDAEVARLTETVNRQDRVFTEFVNSTATDFREVAERLLRLEGREELIAPETVAVPRSLVDALDGYFNGPSGFDKVAQEYRAWKAGQR